MMRFIGFRNICDSVIVLLNIKVKHTKRSEEESRQNVSEHTYKFLSYSLIMLQIE